MVLNGCGANAIELEDSGGGIIVLDGCDDILGEKLC